MLHQTSNSLFKWTDARIEKIFNLAAETKLQTRIYQRLFALPRQRSVLPTNLLPKDTEYGYMLPVHIAAKHGNLEFLSQTVVSGRFSLYETTAFHTYTTLHIATKEKHVACVQFLLTRCPSLCTRKNRWEETPLNIAMENNDLVSAEMLLRCDPSIVFASAKNPLHDAMFRRSTAFIDLLIKFVPNYLEHVGLYALFVGIDVDIIEYVLQLDTSLLDKIERASGQTPLHMAVARKKNAAAVVSLLLKHKPSLLDAKDNAGKTAMDLADEQAICRVFDENNQATLAIEAMLVARPDFKYLDCVGNTTLYAAVKTSTNLDVIASVYRFHPEYGTIGNKYDKTAFDLALQYRNEVAVEFLESVLPTDTIVASYVKTQSNIDGLRERLLTLCQPELIPDIWSDVFLYLGFPKAPNKRKR